MDDIDITLSITHEEVVTSGTKHYTVYWIDVEAGHRQWTIKRRFSECLELHKLLEKRFGSRRVPKFPTELRSDARRASVSKSVKKEYKDEKREKLNSWFIEVARSDGDIIMVSECLVATLRPYNCTSKSIAQII